MINHSIIIYNYFCGISNQFLVRLGMHINETLRPKTSHSISELELIINKNGLNWVKKRLSTFYSMDSFPLSIGLNNLNDRISFVKFVKFSAQVVVICDVTVFNVSKEWLSNRKTWSEVRYSQKNSTLWTVRLQWLLFFTLEWYKNRYNHRVTFLLVVILKHATDYPRLFW